MGKGQVPLGPVKQDSLLTNTHFTFVCASPCALGLWLAIALGAGENNTLANRTQVTTAGADALKQTWSKLDQKCRNASHVVAKLTAESPRISFLTRYTIDFETSERITQRMNGNRYSLNGRLGGLLLALVVPCAAAYSQSEGEGRPGTFTGTIPQQAARSNSAASGSGHPLMAPDAIDAAVANFDRCITSLWPQAAQRGISRRTFEGATRGLEPDLKILELLDTQPEFTKPVWEYLDILVNDSRIATGREAIVQNRAVYDAVEKAYGVDRYILTAIWGVESNFGTQGGDRPVVQSTATLSCIGRRQKYFRDEFLTALEILEHGDVPAEHLKGSWAGAFGPTQFMPTSFKRFAVDFDGDGKRNVVDSIPDMLASTANNLKRDGWQVGASWGYEVALPANFNFMMADRSIRKRLREWEALGVRRVGGKQFPRLGDMASLLVLAGARGPAFLVIDNFRVIMKYNPSEAYALAIGHLADRIRGGEPIVQAWPRDEVMLTRTERLELQERLAVLGYDIGESDGNLGPKTRAALRDFQSRTGLVPDGFASGKILERLRRN
jgi:membrane-bound lytic murein transglycosylase B